MYKRQSSFLELYQSKTRYTRPSPPPSPPSLLHQIDQILGDVPGNAQIDHPVHEVEAEEHDGEDDAAVLVNVASAHAKHAVGRLSGRQRRRHHNGHGGEGRAAAAECLLLLAGGVAGQRVMAPAV